jgi:signal transduction histidine kinase/CheY-like chemotaxis protein
MKPSKELDVETVLEALQALNDGIAIYGPDDRQLFVNEIAFRRFSTYYQGMADGMTHMEALAAQFRQSMPDATDGQVAEAVQHHFSYFQTGDTYMTRTEDGRTVLASFRQMSRDRKVGISVDVTDLRRRERELEKAKKLAEAASQSKSAFLANMSHEIRTPLNGIMGMAQVLENTDLDKQQHEFISTILESGKTLMALLNDVLDLSKIEAGKFDIVPTDASVHHMMRRQMRLWKPRAEEKGLELSLAFDAELPGYLSFDTVRVQQCVSNIVSNAIKFTTEGRVEIFVTAKPAGDAHMVEVRVRDTGPGMDAETLGRLFQPFAQADETIQRVHGGSGLGLSITRRLAELMGGSASATSEPGRGSTFSISFRGDRARTQPEAGVNARPSHSGDIREILKQSNLRVLLVDDHPVNRQVASLFLRPFNMRIVEAVNGAEALAALERETFDVVLLDMHMPVMDGPTAIGHIRASDKPWANIPVIALTADAMSGDRERYLAMGMTGYLSKPLAERDLLSEIARVRDGAAPQHLAQAS